MLQKPYLIYISTDNVIRFKSSFIFFCNYVWLLSYISLISFSKENRILIKKIPQILRDLVLIESLLNCSYIT